MLEKRAEAKSPEEAQEQTCSEKNQNKKGSTDAEEQKCWEADSELSSQKTRRAKRLKRCIKIKMLRSRFRTKCPGENART